MELKVARGIRTENSTIGQFFINGVKRFFSLEDKDRGLKKADAVAEIQRIKVHGKTAIPAGRYEVVISYSDRFKQQMPLLLEVPGFAGIRIHPGNTALDTDGCILLGKQQGKDWIGTSRESYNELMETLRRVSPKEKVYITVE